MHSTSLNPTQRANALDRLATVEYDILVIGGGITGAGIALDAQSRGYRTGIVEAQDWASGTSSRSSRMMHGGLRYLYQLDFPLVSEALRERGLLMSTIAPHLVRPQPFLWPLKTPVIERSYSAVGVGMYDALAVAGALGKRIVPTQKHYNREETKELFPSVDESLIVGSIQYYDSRVDDARMVIATVRAAVGYGADAVSRCQVIGFEKNEDGRVVAALAIDLETMTEFKIRAKHFIQAAGVWTEEIQHMATPDGGLQVLASKGIHILVPRDKIKAKTGMFLRTEKSVLFIIPWQYYWVIGTTDTAWHEQLRNPVPTAEDIDYVIEHANVMLNEEDKITRDDVIGTYAGLRPLLQPKVKEGSNKDSTKVSREHTTIEVTPGLIAIAGGKYTTYRVMAKDAVDMAIGDIEARRHPSRTETIGVVGADGFDAIKAQVHDLQGDLGIDESTLRHLLGRYGSEVEVIFDLIRENPALGERLEACPWYLKAEIAMAVLHEGALHLEDIFIQRVRLNSETRDRGAGAVDQVLEIIAPIMGWNDARIQEERTNYLNRVKAELLAERQTNDAGASAARGQAKEMVPMLGGN
ncbi:glycerol-3-phosphate dehydrogenase/oxidase [Stomatohabitans albus]|uniref:glycerol-3-phosphate dehydrogenase/oxidase n=1 Tax=Stomatohabitans albus TaxID=3110766 RepID=UPI00300CE1EA